MQARLAAVRILGLRQPQRLDAVLVQARQVEGHSGGWLRCMRSSRRAPQPARSHKTSLALLKAQCLSFRTSKVWLGSS